MIHEFDLTKRGLIVLVLQVQALVVRLQIVKTSIGLVSYGWPRTVHKPIETMVVKALLKHLNFILSLQKDLLHDIAFPGIQQNQVFDTK